MLKYSGKSLTNNDQFEAIGKTPQDAEFAQRYIFRHQVKQNIHKGGLSPSIIVEKDKNLSYWAQKNIPGF